MTTFWICDSALKVTKPITLKAVWQERASHAFPPNQTTPCTSVEGGVSGHRRECRAPGLMAALHKLLTATEAGLPCCVCFAFSCFSCFNNFKFVSDVCFFLELK